MNCLFCNSTNTTKAGFRRLAIGTIQRYFCNDCGKKFTPEVEDNRSTRESNHQGPRILYLDIETAPMVVYTWQLKTDYIPASNIITTTYMLSWAAKWAGESKVMGGVLTPEEAVNHDDSIISKSIHQLLCETDLAVAYNGDRFDFQKLNYRFIVNNLTPPSFYRTIDPIKSLRRQFGFDSNKMDHVNSELGLDRKTDTDFNLWRECASGNQAALTKLHKYNKNDVRILEDNYLRLRPWMRIHPNVGVYFDWEGEMCRICGSKNVREVLDKWAYTTVGKYALYTCPDCGAESMGRHNELEKDKRKGLIK